MKFLIWFLILFLVIWYIRTKQTKAAKKPTQSPNTRSPDPATSEPMLQCSQCGVFLPASEAVQASSGNAYCCEEHRHLHTRS